MSNIKHGKSRTRLYNIWIGMIQRCQNPKATQYADYGGRGIKVCPEWKSSFLTFCIWAENNGYKNNLTIERVDNTKDYIPSNCKWVTLKEQQGNKRETVTYHYIDYNGTRDTLLGWSHKLGSKTNIVWWRLKRGWSIEKAITTPIDIKRRNKLCQT